jgi:flagellin
MIAGISQMGSFLSALRVSEAARARQETLQQQIASGREVNSAKDDGARWQMAQNARAEARMMDLRATLATKYEGAADELNLRIERAQDLYRQLKDLALRGIGTALNSPERNALEAEWDQTIKAIQALPTNTTLSGFGGAEALNPTAQVAWGVQPLANDSLFAGFAFRRDHNSAFRLTQPMPVTMGTLDFGAVSDATLADTVISAQAVIDLYAAGAARDATAVANHAAGLGDIALLLKDQYRQAAGRLTDADLGRVSTDLDAARTRAETAQAGISRALDIYARNAAGALSAALDNWSRVRAFA